MAMESSIHLILLCSRCFLPKFPNPYSSACGFGHGALHEFTGSTIPFAETDAERIQTGDPRASIVARYGHAKACVDAIRKAAEMLVAERLMIAEDVDRCVAAAANWHAPRHRVSLR
jgi:hypothetical protein